MMHPRGRRRQPNLALMMLGLQMARVGFNNIPPVTLATIASQVVIFLRLFNIKWPSIMDVCISPVTVWYREDYTRLVLGAFFHVDEWHLYYNMASFLWKGITLERRLGSGYFLYVLAVFTVLCNTLTVALAMLAEHVLHNPSYLSQCAVGFSGVIFALKVITTHMLPPGTHRILGFIPINSRLAVWAELVVIQLLVPRASFIGHLAGILVGTAYCKGPLKYLMNLVIISPPSYTYVSAPSGSRSFTSGTGGDTTGYASGYSTNTRRRQDYYTGSQPSAPIPEDYSGGMSEDEQIQRAMYESMRDPSQNSNASQASAPPGEYDGNGGVYSTDRADNHPMPAPPPYPGRTNNSGNTQTPYTGTGNSSEVTGSQKLYPDLRTVTGESSQKGGQGSNRDQDELRRRRLARFS